MINNSQQIFFMAKHVARIKGMLFTFLSQYTGDVGIWKTGQQRNLHFTKPQTVLTSHITKIENQMACVI